MILNQIRDKTTVKQRQGKAGKGEAQVYDNGTRNEGLGVRGETEEVEVDDSGGKKKSFRSG